MKVKVDYFSCGKNNLKNEDYFNYDESNFVLSDGATDSNGHIYDNKTGGEIISRLIVNESLSTEMNGVDLANYLTNKVNDLYKEIIPDIILDPERRFSATLICARVVNEKIIITQIGDSFFRINQKHIYRNDKEIDAINSKARSSHIKQTGNIAGGRDIILPILKNQYKLQNNFDDPLGYGVINGNPVPESFIKVYTFDLKDINTLELISDGYFSIPEIADIKLYEEEHKKVEQEDPDKYLKFLSTKSSDDRTIAIVSFV